MKRRNFILTLILSAGTACFAGNSQAAGAPQKILCEGTYRGHLQGLDNDGENIFWAFTTELAKTDGNGKLLKKIDVPNHHGDLCCHDGVVYVAVNRGQFNKEPGKAVSEIWTFRTDDLSFIAKYDVPEVVHGAGGIAYRDGFFYVVGGLPDSYEENYVYQYTPDFKFVKRHVLKTGHTHLGFQTACFTQGKFWFGFYGKKGNPSGTMLVPPTLDTFERTRIHSDVGVTLWKNEIWLGKTSRTPDGWTGWLVPMQK
ncbi:MAG: hypothetical protein J6J31_08620 [Thermoguttaceae bacterium]|nr:hypothetical protein [Thermoguttaceae bacterium]